MNWIMNIPPEAWAIISTIVTGLFGAWASIQTYRRAQLKQAIEAQSQAHQREIADIRREIEQNRASNEQNKALVEVIHTTIKENSASNNRVADGLDKLADIQRDTEKSNGKLIDYLEVVSAQLGNVSESSKRAENASLKSAEDSARTLQVVTEKTERIEQRIKSLEQELSDIRETQELYVVKQGERHAAIEKHLKEQFLKVDSELQVLKSDVASIRDLLTNPPKPPNEVDLKQPEIKHEDIA